jgi:hypothetical protein
LRAEGSTIELLRFGVIVFVAALDNVLQELRQSAAAAVDHLRERLRGAARIVRGRLRRR